MCRCERNAVNNLCVNRTGRRLGNLRYIYPPDHYEMDADINAAGNSLLMV